MTIDNAYIAIRDRLLASTPEPATGILTVDWDNDHAARIEAGDSIDGLRLPAAVVRWEPQDWSGLGHDHNHTDALVYVDILQSVVGERLTSDRDPARTVEARAQFELAQRCAVRLHRLSGQGFGPFKMVLSQQDHSYQRLHVYTLGFRTRLHQYLGPVLLPHNAPDPVIIPQVVTGVGGDYGRDFGADFFNAPVV
ncbi:MAG TPA: hypothetical protein PKE21_13765 [Flavobacteriales bacterium]|nr:hypothetical protein [Flavobacteriales bacterium]HMR28544.1 hypothetical protein [Flavobacteriales bacterium]